MGLKCTPRWQFFYACFASACVVIGFTTQLFLTSGMQIGELNSHDIGQAIEELFHSGWRNIVIYIGLSIATAVILGLLAVIGFGVARALLLCIQWACCCTKKANINSCGYEKLRPAPKFIGDDYGRSGEHIGGGSLQFKESHYNEGAAQVAQSNASGSVQFDSRLPSTWYPTKAEQVV